MNLRNTSMFCIICDMDELNKQLGIYDICVKNKSGAGRQTIF